MLRSEPCNSKEHVVSVNGVSQGEIRRQESEAKRLQLEEEQRKKNAEDLEKRKRAQADISTAQTGETSLERIYRSLPASTRYYNPNTTEPCRSLVEKIRRLENHPSYDSSPAIQRSWSNAANYAIQMKCSF